jgi:hypothetical protein
VTWSSVAGLGISAASVAAFVIMAWKLMSALFSSRLTAARTGDQLAAEKAAHVETRAALVRSEASYAQLHASFTAFARTHVSAATDAEALRLAGGDLPPPVLGDGLLDPFSDKPDGAVVAGASVLAPG